MLKTLLICTIGISYLMLVTHVPFQNILQFCQKKFPSSVTIHHTHLQNCSEYIFPLFSSLLFLLHDDVVPRTVGLLFSLDG